MNEEALQDAYNLFVQTGYNQDINAFKQLIGSNPEALQDAFNLFTQTGYNQNIDSFKGLMGVGAAPMAVPVQPQEEVKKKVESDTTELPVAGSLSGSQLPQEPVKPQFFQSSLDVITPQLIDKTEEFVVPKMNYQFGPMGFKFEESGMTGDWMVATAPNGKTMEFSLDPAFGMGADKEANKLKSFISENTTTEALKTIENQYAAENKKFNNQKQIDEELASINQTAESFKNETNAFLAEKTSLEGEKKYFESVPANQVKDQAYLDRYAQYMQKGGDLTKKQQDLVKRQDELQSRSQQLNSAVGKYVEMESEQGTKIGAGINAWWEGVGAQAAGLINNVIDATFSKYLLGADEDDIKQSIEGKVATGNAQEDAKDNAAIANAIRINETRKDVNQRMAEKTPIPLPKEGQSYAEWYSSLTDEQRTDIVDKANDDIKKDLKINILPAAREGARTVLGDDNTTVAYSRLLEEGFWGGALLGTAKSLPALIGGNNAMGWAMRTANMYAQNTDAIYKEMEQNPNFKDISEQEKFNIIAPIGITSAALESLGFRNVIANKGLLNRIALAAIGKAGVTTTAKTFGDLVKNEAKTMLSKGLLTLAGAGLAEAETGAAQQVSEYAFKELYNAMKGKEMFITPDFMSAAYVKDVAKAGAQEMIGGFVLGTLPAISAAYSKQGYHAMDDNLFKIFEKGANDENLHKAIVADIKLKVSEGKMTLKEGKEMLNNYRNSIGLFNSLPDNLDTNEKKSAMNLLKEKRDLEQQIEGKDESLTRRQRTRISDINTELETLGETAATRPISIILPTGNEVQIQREKEDDLNALMSEYNQLSEERNEFEKKSKVGADGLFDVVTNTVDFFNSEQELNDELQKRWEQTDLAARQAEIVNEITALATPAAAPAPATQQAGILSSPEMTLAALEQLPTEDRINLVFTQEDGTETPVMGNEQMLSNLYHQAMATPEAERTPAQLDAIETVQVSLKTQLEQEVQQQAQAQQARPARGKNKGEVFRNTMKSLVSILPGIKVTFHKNETEMKGFAETLGNDVSQQIFGGQNGVIVYDASGKPTNILINEETSDATTLPHEVWHAIFFKAFGDNPQLFNEFRDRTRQILLDNGYNDIVDLLDVFEQTEEYVNSNTQGEEWMVHLGGLLTASDIDATNLSKKSKSLLEQLKGLLNEFAKRITGQPMFLEDATPEDVLDFMVAISDRMSRGESIADFFRNQEERQGEGEGGRVKSQVSAYHGSPYEFDRFTTDKMGTGEGAQAFGWGLYFTDLKEIAKHYADILSTKNINTLSIGPLKIIDNKKYVGYDVANNETERLITEHFANNEQEIKNAFLQGKDLNEVVNSLLNDFISELKSELKSASSPYSTRDEDVAYYKNAIKEANRLKGKPINVDVEANRNIYEVTLHEGKTPEQYTWLEWDKFVSNNIQKPIKQGLTQEQYKQGFYNVIPSLGLSSEKTIINGEELYNSLVLALGSPKQASLFLLENGIDGVKYPAESISRRVTSEAARGFNYVVFDENAVTVNQRIKAQQAGKTGIAPNGKPSNLTPEQYRLVRTPEFKAWFGDWENDPANASKVVDENGEPLVVYHGTYLYQDAYTILNKITYFTDNRITAEKYPIDGYVYFKTFDDYADEFNIDENDIKKLSEYYDIDKIKRGSILVREDDSFEIWKGFDPNKLYVYECFLNFKNPKVVNSKEEDLTYIDNDNDNRVIEYKNEDYDSIIGIYPYRWFSQDKIDYEAGKRNVYKEEKHFITFNSNQIKLADGTNTTFDKTNPNIKFQQAGKTGIEERRIKEETNRAKVREYNQKAKEDRGKNISVKDFDTIKKRGQDLKVGDVYARRIGDAVYVFKVLSNLRKLNGQFYTMNVEVLDTGTDYVRQELGPVFDIKEVGKKVGDKSIDSFKNLASPSGGLNFGEVTVLQDYESKTAETTPTIKAQAGETGIFTIEPIDFENESENIDVDEASEKANQIAKDNGVNILRGKDLKSVALDNYGNVVGGLWTEISGDEFSFDVAVDKSMQGKGIGERLVNEAISEFNAENFEDQLKYKIDVTNPVMEKLLSKYGFKVIERIDGHTMMEHPTNNPKIKSKQAKPRVKSQIQTEGTSLFRTEEDANIGFQYDTDKVARERFNIYRLKKIGAGSDRVVFDLGDGKVLKIAKTARGLEQNIYEGDGYLTIIPNVFERGLNYVVTEKADRLKAADMVPVYNEDGDQTGEVRASEMINELQRFTQKDFDNHRGELQDVLMKYGLQEIMNYNVLWNDFTAIRNWGYKDGMPMHTDGGTFGGVDMLTSRPSKSLTDPEFREVYNKSKQAKKEFADTDAYTKFQKSGNTGIEQVRKVAQRYNVNSQGFAPKQVNDAAMKKELAPFGFSVKRARVDEQGRGGGVFIIDGNGRFYNPFRVKSQRISLGAGRFMDDITAIPGYDRMLEEVNAIIVRTKRRGASQERIMKGVMDYVQTSAVYERANDVQREQIVRNIQTEFGKRLKSAPSVGRLLGTIKDIKNITLSEKELLKQQIKSLARGARTATAAWRVASRELANEIKELVLSGKVTTKQVSSVLKRFANVNMFSDDSVDKFVDYMTKVFEDANYAEKIDRARRLLPTAKRNIRTKIGISEAAAPLLQQMFAINPSLIPDAVLDKYLSLVEMFGEKATVLTLADVSTVIATTNEVLDAVDEEVSLAEELAIRFENYPNKVLDNNGDLDYAATLAQMKEQNVITEEDAKLMQKYKSLILPKVQKPEMTEAEIEQEKDRLISVIGSLSVNDSALPTRDERGLAQQLKSLLKPEILKQLTIPQLKNVIKLIDNISNGYLPHYAELTVERLDAINKTTPLISSIKTAVPLMFEKAYSRLKSEFTKKGTIVEMTRRGPTFNIDQVFGDFKTKNIYDSLFKAMSKAQALFDSEINKVNKKLDEAHDAVAKSYRNDSNDTLLSSFKMMTYMLQLEYESNPNNKEVHPVSKVLNATIKHIDNGKSRYGDREANMLEQILKDYAPNGEIDIEALYDSFNPAEKKAIKTIQELNKSMRDKAVYTAAVIRGDRINPLNNYVHHYVMHEFNPDENATGVQTADAYNNSMRPSTRAQSLIERTNKVSPMNFDVFASAQRGAKFVLLDYTMTKPIRTGRKTLNQARVELEKDGRIPKEQRETLNAIESAFNEVVANVLTNNMITDSRVEEIVNFISKTGYRAILGSVPRFVSELTSNLGTVIFDPKSFADGVKLFKKINGVDAENIMKNSKSVQTNRLYGGQALSGKFIDTSVLGQTTGIKSAEAKGDVANVVNKIYNNSLKKYKNFVELTADTLISTPDRLVMRPFWLGAYANAFKKETGQDIDLDKVAANDEAYMNEYKDAIDKATDAADTMSVRVGATDNPFMGILKGTVKPNQSVFTRAFNNFNNFMTRFAIYEYTTAREGIYAAMGNGMITKRQGYALLAGVATRMTVYTLLSQMLGNGMLSLFADDDEDDEKTFMQKFSQSLASTATGLIIGRNFGNATKGLLNYGVEEMNEKFLTGLREGDYDPYKDAISYSIIPKERKGHKTNLTDFLTQIGGSFGPSLKTADLIARKMFEAPKKEEAAIERGKKETQIRIPLEVLGHLGYVPLYKDIRKIVMDQMYKDLENAGKKADDKKQAEKEMLHGYENKTDMKRYNPELYEQVFGEKSPGYDAEQAKKKIEKEKDDLERRRKDEFYDYTPKKTQEESGGFGSKPFGGKAKKESGGFGSKKFGE